MRNERLGVPCLNCGEVHTLELRTTDGHVRWVCSVCLTAQTTMRPSVSIYDPRKRDVGSDNIHWSW